MTLPPRSYCIARIKLIDGRSFTTVASEGIINPKTSDWYQSMNVFKEVPDVRWTDTTVYTPEEPAKCGTALNQALAVAAPFTLRRVRLL